MIRETIPEVRVKYTRDTNGRQVVVHEIDKFPRHREQIISSIYSSAYAPLNTSSAVRFELPYGDYRGPCPELIVTGNGLDNPRVFMQNMLIKNFRGQEDNPEDWELCFKPEHLGALRLEPLRRWPALLHGIPTIKIAPFLQQKHEVDALKRYNLWVRGGDHRLQIEADCTAEERMERLVVRYIETNPTGPKYTAVDLGELKPTDRGWQVKTLPGTPQNLKPN